MSTAAAAVAAAQKQEAKTSEPKEEAAKEEPVKAKVEVTMTQQVNNRTLAYHKVRTQDSRALCSEIFGQELDPQGGSQTYDRTKSVMTTLEIV